MRRFNSALLVASTVSLAVGYTAVPAGAGSSQTFSLSSSSTSVTTSTGKHVDVQVTAFKSAGDSNYSVNVSLSTGGAKHHESHFWTLQPNSGSFDYNNGTGTLKTGALPQNFGSLDLTFHKSSQQTHNCPTSGSTTAVRGTLKGALDFDSKSDSWGKVHVNNLTFETPNFINVNDSCTGEGGDFVLHCYKGTSWASAFQAGMPNGGGFSVVENGDTTTTINGSRFVLLGDGSVYRSDSVSDVARTPVIDGSKLTVRTKKGTAVKGRATISGGQSNDTTAKCTKSGKKFTEHSTQHASAKWESAHGIKFNDTAFSDFKTVLSGDNASWSKNSYK